MRTFSVYFVFIAVTFLVGMMSAYISPPGEWYDQLQKPWFNPPKWLFPVAWTVLYIMIGAAGARVWLAGLMGAPLLFWILQTGLAALWSYLFFSLQSPLFALLEAIIFFAAIVGFILTTWREERVASFLFVPYAIWVGFAAFLTAAILYLNW